MRILGAMLGGTISSYCVSGTIKLGKPSFVREFLIENFPFNEFIIPEFETYSSENATPELYRNALKKIIEETKKSKYDGVLITHGTDTCAFFAQLAARVLSGINIPYVITGAMHAPDIDPKEASGNLMYAVQCLEEGRTGVVFRDENGEHQLYQAHLIMSPDIYGLYSEYRDGSSFHPKEHPDFFTKKLPKILTVSAVPGNVAADGDFDRVLICCNHSGTASEDLISLVERWTREGKECYMAPIPRKGAVYESRKKLREAGAIELTGMPLEGAWCEVLLR
ncbi:asparaginase domain-containing protein [Butyrivibrio sp. AE2032]|uniref:asparaginase domain-containing protein n=1 Tax=Butyrivibrio sp. AE2032 TaxID=1458463 RepID=UPI00054E9D7A|nr:asparaginase domain-containing protein [Butyrivibrio sp. AE2032]